MEKSGREDTFMMSGHATPAEADSTIYLPPYLDHSEKQFIVQSKRGSGYSTYAGEGKFFPQDIRLSI
jgi:hypothetical protein